MRQCAGWRERTNEPLPRSSYLLTGDTLFCRWRIKVGRRDVAAASVDYTGVDPKARELFPSTIRASGKIRLIQTLPKRIVPARSSSKVDFFLTWQRNNFQFCLSHKLDCIPVDNATNDAKTRVLAQTMSKVRMCCCVLKSFHFAMQRRTLIRPLVQFFLQKPDKFIASISVGL